MLPPDEQPVQSVNQTSRAMVPHGAPQNGMMPQSADYDASYYDGFPAQPQSPEILTNPFDASWVWHSFRRRWVLATGMGLLVGVALAATTWFLTPKQFTAKSMIHVKSKQPYAVFKVDTGVEETEYKLFQATQIQLIKSPRVLTSAVRKRSVSSQPEMKNREQNEHMPWLSENLLVSFSEGSEILEISMNANENEEEYLAYVTAVTESYLNEVVGRDKRDKAVATESLSRELDKKTDALKELSETYITQVQNLGIEGSKMAAVDKELLLEQISGMMKQRSDYEKQLSLLSMKYQNDKQLVRDREYIKQGDNQRMGTDPFLQQLLYEQSQIQSEMASARIEQSESRATASSSRLQKKLSDDWTDDWRASVGAFTAYTNYSVTQTRTRC